MKDKVEQWIQNVHEFIASRWGFYVFCIVFVILGMLSTSQCVTAVALYKRERMLKMANEKIAAAEKAALRLEAHAEASMKAYTALSMETEKKIQWSLAESRAIEEKKKTLQRELEKEKQAIKKLDLKGALHAFKELGY